MFCYQCEQTDRTASPDRPNLLSFGCSATKGNCGKDATTAALQDVLVHVNLGIGQYAQKARQLGAPDPVFAAHASFDLFTTLTNVNFNATRFMALISDAVAMRETAKLAYENAARAAGVEPEALAGPAQFEPAATISGVVAQGATVGVDAGLATVGADVVGLRNLNLYGLKGVCAYAHHAHALGYRTDETDAGIESALAFLADQPADADALLGHALNLGALNLDVMAMLDAANTGSFGSPVPTPVRVTPVAGKAILVSGHDLHDLARILEATEGAGINVYTHGEMLPAHGYPELHKYRHLVGNYGGAWQDQQRDFTAFPGPIVMTSNCLIEPQPAYRNRIFTLGPVGWPGIRHLDSSDLSLMVKAALSLPGFTADAPAETVTTGFGRDAVLSVADTVIQAVKDGAIRRFLLIGGCDGAAPGRNYYTDVADHAPADTVLMTLGCNKYRFNTHEFGEIGGIPRLLDVGQCNDSYSAVQIALALADAFDCGVNDLPLSLFVSWFEQKAAAVLLTLLSLGIRNIRLGPTLPAFLTPAVVDILVDKFALKPIGDPAQDLADAMAGA
ncbi:hydroxylamine reductase [Candidatus Mycolicibacterium alkanivorans]|uniref:Hydroxylamine reductase n=1 Tax=Candidatus Mycolicibacterium alkanivorans TaxID=2954114 RepID=A0ABS9Z073_9MYCO|nr:hydroxylamine reductase [Candidatus Mycolicibacterium alkanivorans]MCI4676742.1 hydroxylamine reductase [Candidatus Mycolicibacterium alkanivorans]